MDASEVKRIVEANIEPMMRTIGIPHWRVIVDYDALGGNTVANVDLRDLDYWRAFITFDPMECADEERVLSALRHELLHILAAPFQMYREVMLGGPIDPDAEGRLFRHAMEQQVTWLERGLASKVSAQEVDDEVH